MPFVPHMNILPPEQASLWPELASVHAHGFVLYGGTAIALRLGHWQSIDFDFFLSRPFTKQTLFNSFDFLQQAKVIQESKDTLTVLVPTDENTEVKILFFGDVNFGRVGTPDMTPDNVMLVASMDDLLALKLAVILQRIEAKDYIDIAAIVEAGNDTVLAKGLAGARALYGKAFQPAESMKALTYFKGGDLKMITLRDRENLIEAVTQVRELPVSDIISHTLNLEP